MATPLTNQPQKFWAKVGATAQKIKFVVQDENGLCSLTGATVTLTAKNLQTGTKIINDQACTLDADQVTNTGLATYTLKSSEVAKAGTYAVLIKVVYPGGTVDYYPRGSGDLKYNWLIIDDVL